MRSWLYRDIYPRSVISRSFQDLHVRPGRSFRFLFVGAGNVQKAQRRWIGERKPDFNPNHRVLSLYRPGVGVLRHGLHGMIVHAMRCEGRGDGGPSFLSNPPKSRDRLFHELVPPQTSLGPEGRGQREAEEVDRGKEAFKEFQGNMTHLGDFMSPSACNSVPLAAAIAFPSTKAPPEDKKARRKSGGGAGGGKGKKRDGDDGVWWWWWSRGEKKKL